jgi:hypothetical protein
MSFEPRFHVGSRTSTDRPGARPCRKSREPASVFAAAGPGWGEPAFMGGDGGRTPARAADRAGQRKRICRAKTLRNSLDLSFTRA